MMTADELLGLIEEFGREHGSSFPEISDRAKELLSRIEGEIRYPEDLARETWSATLAALDRCEHGRHKQDNCFTCPGGQSTGNLFLLPGTRIGTTLYGDPITAPEQEERGYSSKWLPQEDGAQRRMVIK